MRIKHMIIALTMIMTILFTGVGLTQEESVEQKITRLESELRQSRANSNYWELQYRRKVAEAELDLRNASRQITADLKAVLSDSIVTNSIKLMLDDLPETNIIKQMMSTNGVK